MSSLRRTLLHLPARVLAAVGLAVGVLTAVAALLSWWAAAVAGLVLLDLLVLAAVLRRPAARQAPASKAGARASTTAPGILALERRIDALSARVVAVSERTRVDVLEALSTGRRAPTDHE